MFMKMRQEAWTRRVEEDRKGGGRQKQKEKERESKRKGAWIKKKGA